MFYECVKIGLMKWLLLKRKHNVYPVIGPFFFHERTITADVYLDLLTEYVAPQLIDSQPTIILQQDGAPLHWGLRVRQFLNETFSDRWIGREVPIS